MPVNTGTSETLADYRTFTEQMCDAIDKHEAAEHFQRLLMEYYEWLVNLQRQQEAVQLFLREYYMWANCGIYKHYCKLRS